jgi:hypothetical protein
MTAWNTCPEIPHKRTSAKDRARSRRHPVGRGGRDQVVPVPAHPPAHRSRQPPQASWRPSQAHHQFMTGGVGERGEGGHGGLAAPGLIRADHALRDTRPGSQFYLGQPSSLPCLAEQGSSRPLRIHALV